jgi:DNA-binding GntR family transcriptional regulator
MPMTPLYEQIANDIRAKIASGEWPVGHQLPSHTELQTQYKASTTAVRNALLLLGPRGEGLVDGQQGKGRYVVRKP